MSQKNVPEELNARRDKILSLYKDGLSVADIARYIEVTPAYILSSFCAIGLSPDKNRISGSISDFRKEKKKGKMDQRPFPARSEKRPSSMMKPES